jgi:hypothetical protein
MSFWKPEKALEAAGKDFLDLSTSLFIIIYFDSLIEGIIKFNRCS